MSTVFLTMPPTSSLEPDALVGQTIGGRYRIVSRLAAGGMGVTYRAMDDAAGVPVVVKMPNREVVEDRRKLARFQREIDLMRSVSHPHVVPIIDAGDHDSCPFIVMRFLPGGSLAKHRLRNENDKARPSPPTHLHFWLPSVSDALDHLHGRRIVHRDVKPENIFFDAYRQAFLGDFGIAKMVERDAGQETEEVLTAAHSTVGTVDYMAPELFQNVPPTGSIDQYALAIVVYEWLAGKRPFSGEMTRVILQITGTPPKSLKDVRPDLPDSLCKAVDKALSKKPADRFPSCAAFAKAALADVSPGTDRGDRSHARLLCPGCGRLLLLPPNVAGRRCKCPKCDASIKVASDLGSLWLIGEQVETEESQADAEFFRVTPSSTRVRRRWRVHWAEIAALVAALAAGAGLTFVSLPLGLAVLALSAVVAGGYAAFRLSR